MTPSPALSVDEYLRQPESVLPQELAYGVWRVADAPTPRHQSFVFAFGLALDQHTRPTALGRVYLAPVDVILDRDRHVVIQPDLVFISMARLAMVTDRIWGAPDLAVEILSPKPRIGDLDQRLGWFAEYGVRECWLVDQFDRRVEVLQFAAGGVRSRETFRDDEPIRSGLLPDWDAPLADVLADRPEIAEY